MLKIDVETHEPEVLEGLGKYLHIMKPTILIEILTDEVAVRVEAIVRDKGYLYFDIDEKQKPSLVQHLSKSSFYNYLICQPEVAVKLKLL